MALLICPSGKTQPRHSGARHFARTPESITTKFSWDAMWLPVMFDINIGGYGFRARASRAPK
jgi:hypothetical protein